MLRHRVYRSDDGGRLSGLVRHDAVSSGWLDLPIRRTEMMATNKDRIADTTAVFLQHSADAADRRSLSSILASPRLQARSLPTKTAAGILVCRCNGPASRLAPVLHRRTGRLKHSTTCLISQIALASLRSSTDGQLDGGVRPPGELVKPLTINNFRPFLGAGTAACPSLGKLANLMGQLCGHST